MILIGNLKINYMNDNIFWSILLVVSNIFTYIIGVKKPSLIAYLSAISNIIVTLGNVNTLERIYNNSND